MSQNILKKKLYSKISKRVNKKFEMKMLNLQKQLITSKMKELEVQKKLKSVFKLYKKEKRRNSEKEKRNKPKSLLEKDSLSYTNSFKINKAEMVSRTKVIIDHIHQQLQQIWDDVGSTEDQTICKIQGLIKTIIEEYEKELAMKEEQLQKIFYKFEEIRKLFIGPC